VERAEKMCNISLSVRIEKVALEKKKFNELSREILKAYSTEVSEIEEIIVGRAEKGEFRAHLDSSRFRIVRQYPEVLISYLESFGYDAKMWSNWGRGDVLIVKWEKGG